jgi:hypothetical protein
LLAVCYFAFLLSVCKELVGRQIRTISVFTILWRLVWCTGGSFAVLWAVVRHLLILCSHATEGDIPGTLNLAAVDGDDTAYGQALFPVPAEDPNDP